MWRVGFLLWFVPLRGGPLFRLGYRVVLSFCVFRPQFFLWFLTQVSVDSRVTGFSWALAVYNRLGRHLSIRRAFFRVIFGIPDTGIMMRLVVELVARVVQLI